MRYFQITDTKQVNGYEDSDTAGIDYAISQGWIDVTNKYSQPIPPTPVIPTEVSMRQARLALFQGGLLSQVQTSIDALPEPNKTVTQISWDYATIVRRDDDLVTALSSQLGLDSTKLDALFTLAATL